MYRYIMIDSERNMLICDAASCGKGELVEVHERDGDTPSQIIGKILRKIAEPNIFEVHTKFEDIENEPEEEAKTYCIGGKCSLRVLFRNMSGTRRRKFSSDEKVIVNLEHGRDFKETKVFKAKTGSVRRKARPTNTKKGK